ncbi:hypothetical protein BOTBODRAFT_64088 [Botryobasidium botryosum FD-172 SS1]|uniref:Uncharacterized protein n=1 Tax=Botryobasidium botryosum (strain FD-172 SS1) TaxID=930990 RepID=A0A067N1I4_BOTB1|nr:hypothetical protein BOTBODRAFT_64088 [Botryobasidium botryosum FD-172 SS1]
MNEADMELTGDDDYFSHLFRSVVWDMMSSAESSSTEEPLRPDSLKSTRNNMYDYHACLVAARAAVSPIIKDHAMAYLRSRQNQLSPMHRLQIPDEIFSMIFELAVPAGRKDPREAPLAIAAVSRSWRRIALATPRIWTRITNSSVHHFLPRARSAPLEVEYRHVKDRRSTSLKNFLSPLIPHSDQWRVLHLAMHDTDIPSFADLATTPATNLESLRVTPQSMLGDLDQVDFDIFCGYTPRLRELDLRSLALESFTFPIFCGLVHLRFSTIEFIGTDEDLTYQVLRVISVCPKMEELHLGPFYTTEPSHEGAHSPKISRVPLPSLRVFTLENILNPHIALALMDSIQFPSTTRVRLSVDDDTPFQLFPSIPSPNLCLIDSLHVNWNTRGWDRDGSELLALLNINYHRSAIGNDTTMLFDRILQQYPLPNVTRISVKMHRESDVAYLATIIGHFPLLTDIWLVFGTGVPHATLSALPNSLACPTLRHLYLVDCPIEPAMLLELVQSIFRRADGQPLPDGPTALTLVHCVNINDDTISELGSLIPLLTIRKALRNTPQGELPREYFFPQ